MPAMRITLERYRSARATCILHARIYRKAYDMESLATERALMVELRRAVIIDR